MKKNDKLKETINKINPYIIDDRIKRPVRLDPFDTAYRGSSNYIIRGESGSGKMQPHGKEKGKFIEEDKKEI